MKEKLTPTEEWDKVLLKSEKVRHEKACSRYFGESSFKNSNGDE